MRVRSLTESRAERSSANKLESAHLGSSKGVGKREESMIAIDKVAIRLTRSKCPTLSGFCLFMTPTNSIGHRSSSLLRLPCHAAVVHARYVSSCNTCEPWDGAGGLSLEWFPKWPLGSRMKTNAVEMTLALRLANRSVLRIEVV